ncbi:MAG: aspartate aminotransferase family protein [Bacteroidota bacterium]
MISNRQLFLMHQAQTSLYPLMLEIEKADGVYLYDVNGKKYLDLISGISVSSLGHGNAHVKKAITEQLDQYMHLMVYGEFIQSPQVKLAKKLTDLLPPQLNCVYLVNSGAEATDGAMKLAKRYSGRTEIIACKNAYHGSSHAALSLNSHEYFKNAFRPLLPDISFIEYNNENTLELISDKTACVIIETIQGEAGYIAPQNNFLKKVRTKCDEHQVLLIFDEIQAGMGRTGKMFAFEHYDVVPDILLLGKALGAGMPIGAFIASQKMMSVLADNPYLGHITTFGGHPVIAAAALAGIAELLTHQWMEEINEKENLFRELLVHPAIKNISGKGLMLSVELDNFELNKKIIDACIEDGLITDWFLFAPNCMRIAPPLIINNSQILSACELIIKNLIIFTSN